MRREILVWPDSRLRNKAELVTAFDAALKGLVEDMVETMYAAGGIGLAAPQIGVSKCVVVVERKARKAGAGVGRNLVSTGDGAVVLALVNPVIVNGGGAQRGPEGCLSLPGVQIEVGRYAAVKVQARDLAGEPFEVDATGFFAVQLQHEIDHLDGKLAVDYISALKRDMLRAKFEKQKRRGFRYAPAEE